jgi:hypothetical protein
MSRLRAVQSVINSSFSLAADALLEGRLNTLPMAPQRAVDATAFNHLLAHHGTSDSMRSARVAGVDILDITSVSSNCNNLVLAPQWQHGGEALPTTLFLKLPCPELATRWFCNAIGVWSLECRFFRNFATDFPVRLPRVHALADHRSRFMLLQENLHADNNVRLFTNPDMLAGPDPGIVDACLDTFARVHAHYHDLPATLQEQRLPLDCHPFRSPVMSEISRFINRLAIDPCRRKAPVEFPADTAELYRRAMDRWDTLLDAWYEGPLTLVHGDSHLGNFFADGDRMGMLDFQAAHWSKGIRDVQYFLIDSLPVEQLAARERELVNYYVDALARYGVELQPETAWEQYRGFSFQTLMTIVVSLGLGPLTETDTVMREILRRAVAAVDRVDFRGWLEALPG